AATAALAAAAAAAAASTPTPAGAASMPTPIFSTPTEETATANPDEPTHAATAHTWGNCKKSPNRSPRGPVVMVFRASSLPAGWDADSSVEKAGEWVIGMGSGQPIRVSEGRGSADVEMDHEDVSLPSPTRDPEQAMPCMVGHFNVDEITGEHQCTGFWAMSKKDAKDGITSPFEFKAVPPDDEGGDGDGMGSSRRKVGLSFPHTGSYEGHFLVQERPKPPVQVKELDLRLEFARNSSGGWNVDGRGRNRFGAFRIMGRLSADRKLEVFRAYQ
ncbi:unnamed protein product, partial [Choristocarpus tenellus]